jgi:hypothetical protein
VAQAKVNRTQERAKYMNDHYICLVTFRGQSTMQYTIYGPRIRLPVPSVVTVTRREPYLMTWHAVVPLVNVWLPKGHRTSWLFCESPLENHLSVVNIPPLVLVNKARWYLVSISFLEKRSCRRFLGAWGFSYATWLHGGCRQRSMWRRGIILVEQEGGDVVAVARGRRPASSMRLVPPNLQAI